jgi:polysaccharide chain length determinant protein (PEP-CTERM system associated)
LWGISLGISYTIPPEYMSQTLVLIEQQKVPESYVKSVVNEDLGARLASMREQILSRSRLEPIIERFNLYAGNKATLDDRIDLTRKAIGINPIRSDQTRGMPGFFISFKARDPHVAQQVCGEITSLFVSANLSAREESAEGTTDFLKQQLADSKRNLDDQDARLAAFEQKNIGKLPGQSIKIGDMSLSMGSPNQGTLQALTTQLDATTQKVNRLQQNETILDALIAQAQQGDPASGATEDKLEAQLKDAINQETQLEVVYTPDHPDVLAMKRRIANLKAEIAHASAAPAKSEAVVNARDSSELRKLKLQLRAERQSMAEAKQEQARIERQVRAYEAKIEASPLLEQEYKQVTRDHESALQFYNTLLAKMSESTMATALEHRQQGEQFRVMDAPNLPDQPSYPDHRKIGGAGLAAGLALGLLLAGFLEYRDTAIRNENDIWAFTKLPTLAVISYLDDLAVRPRNGGKRGKLFSRAPKPIERAHG